jgi:hypothetical protein
MAEECAGRTFDLSEWMDGNAKRTLDNGTWRSHRWYQTWAGWRAQGIIEVIDVQIEATELLPADMDFSFVKPVVGPKQCPSCDLDQLFHKDDYICIACRQSTQR